MRTNYDIVFLYHHLGLGDHFVCNGLVRYVLAQSSCSRLYIPTKEHNLFTVQQMYSDDRRILCLPVKSDLDVPSLPELKPNPATSAVLYQVGFSKCREDWDVSFYDSIGLDFSIRWNWFKINRNLESENTLKKSLGLNKQEPYCVVHDNGSIGDFPIRVNSDLRVVKVEKKSSSLLDWCSVIEGAEEVHCVDSSVVHLAQMLNVKRGVFHNIRTKSTLFKLKKEWQVIEYSS